MGRIRDELHEMVFFAFMMPMMLLLGKKHFNRIMNQTVEPGTGNGRVTITGPVVTRMVLHQAAYRALGNWHREEDYNKHHRKIRDARYVGKFKHRARIRR